jgi:AsmA protein
MGARLTDSANPGAERIIKLQANLDVNSNAEHLRTDDLLLSIDDSQIVGSLSIQHFDKPALRLDLQADRIDADRYLLAGAAQSGTAKSSPPLGASIEALRALDFEGEVRVQALTFKGLTMHDVRLTSGAPGG